MRVLMSIIFGVVLASISIGLVLVAAWVIEKLGVFVGLFLLLTIVGSVVYYFSSR